MRVLREMSASKPVCESILILGGVPTLIDLLHDHDMEIQGLAAEIVSQVSKLKAARKIVRVQNGLARLVSRSRLSFHPTLYSDGSATAMLLCILKLKCTYCRHNFTGNSLNSLVITMQISLELCKPLTLLLPDYSKSVGFVVSGENSNKLKDFFVELVCSYMCHRLRCHS